MELADGLGEIVAGHGPGQAVIGHADQYSRGV
jgi:hypothetical protein